MIELLAGYQNRREPFVAVIGCLEIVVTAVAVGRESVTLAPVDGSRRYHCHPNAVVVREMDVAHVT